MNHNPEDLNREEYLHVAMEALRRGDHESALNCLKRGISAYSEDAKLHYLLGATYAQLSLTDLAERHLAQALVIMPTMHTACFQLGLLKLTLGQTDAAIAVWKGLDDLSGNHPLRLFRDGLQALAANQLTAAMDFLAAGIAANQLSPDLSADMEQIMTRVRGLQHSAENADEGPPGHLFLNAYQTADQ